LRVSADAPRIKELFLTAAALPPGDRPEYLAEACGSDAGLRAAIERLLVAHDQPASVLPPSGEATNGPVRRSEFAELHDLSAGRVGAVIGGRYKLIERLGEGGMGEVWVAQQTEPVKRPVAVKLVKPGMDSKLVLARFEAERQALALMDHPNIAKVLDAGSTTEGRPFFVMELVKGVPITEFCDSRKLTLRQRLALFVPVCQAVQHAHQKGVIHRDLKPSNVMVAMYDDRPVPKVIDFGVAKAAGQPLTDRTLLTGFGSVIGTLEYMSPEQATFNALDVDTRTDVYALGVLLYELLTGATPMGRDKLAMVGLLEMLRVVREQDPPKPSTRLSTAATLPAIAAARGTEPRKLAGVVRGELDWIVMRALEKDRTRRYQTANGLSADVERYLNGDPVQAAPPSASYRLQKFARRHRGPVAVAASVLAVLVLGIIGTTVGLVRVEAARESEATQHLAAVGQAEKAVAAEKRAEAELVNANVARDRAERENLASSALASFLHYDMLGAADISKQSNWHEVVNPDLTVREALDRAASRIDERRGWTPRSESMVRWAIGDAYVGLGQPDRGIPHLERAWQLLAADPAFGPGHGETIFGMHKLSVAYRSAGRPDASLPLAQEAVQLSLARHAREPDDLQGPLVAMNDLALAQVALGRGDEAVRQFDEAIRWAVVKYGTADGDWDVLRFNQAEAFRIDGRCSDARRTLADLLNRAERGTDDLWTASIRGALGRVLIDLDNCEAAERLLDECLTTRQRREPKAWTTAESASLLGAALAAQKKYEKAEKRLLDSYREMKALEGTIAPKDRPRLAAAVDRLTDLYTAWNKPDDAAIWRDERAKYPPDKASSPRPGK